MYCCLRGLPVPRVCGGTLCVSDLGRAGRSSDVDSPCVRIPAQKVVFLSRWDILLRTLQSSWECDSGQGHECCPAAVCGKQQGRHEEAHRGLLSCFRLLLSISWRIQERAFRPGSAQLCGPGSHGQNQAGKDGTLGGRWSRRVQNRSRGDLNCLLSVKLGCQGQQMWHLPDQRGSLCVLWLSPCAASATAAQRAAFLEEGEPKEKGRTSTLVLWVCLWAVPHRALTVGVSTALCRPLAWGHCFWEHRCCVPRPK